MTVPNIQFCLARYIIKKIVRHIRQPSAQARLRMSRVVTERLRARARMLQIMKRLPGTPRRKTMLRMRAPKVTEILLLTMLLLFVKFSKELVPLSDPIRKASEKLVESESNVI